MEIKSISFKDIGLPKFHSFDVGRALPAKVDKIYKKALKIENSNNSQLTLFDLSSHKRARESIEFGLQMRSMGFHVFVVGEDRSGRMTATLSYLDQVVKKMPPPSDWVYLNNFLETHRPKPYKLQAGKGIILKTKLSELIKTIHSLFSKTFSSPYYFRQVDVLTSSLQNQIDVQVQKIKLFATEKGYEIVQDETGFNIEVNAEGSKVSTSDLQKIREKLNQLTLLVHLENQKIEKHVQEMKHDIADKAMAPLFRKFHNEFAEDIDEWISELRVNILASLDEFLTGEDSLPAMLDEKYAVNLLVNHKDVKCPKVFLEANPTYENLFGSIKYRTNSGGGLETNFTLIRPGALHIANGGILVLRAESLAKDPDVWEALKASLRDQRIRIEEIYRENSVPLADAPDPKSIPLDVQDFLIASPLWYYSFFFNDPEFRTYFKVKADIDPDLPITVENVNIYGQLIRQAAHNLAGIEIEDPAISYLMGYSSRWVGDRGRLSAQFELISDILAEASIVAHNTASAKISLQVVRDVIDQRRLRNARLEDRSHLDIEEGQVLIDTSGSAVGQVNGLSVLSTGDHRYGLPTRISARTYAGKDGVVNIERLTEMAGPIQQKGALILEGFLNGVFAQKFPLSCSCSLTFEQSYGDIEGDSASMAELVAVLSSLSGIPLRQDIAITGSINQFGIAQAVGGIHYKVEGFYRVCKDRGLTGTQGVILPRSNVQSLTLRDEIIDDIKAGKFSIWPVDSVFEAIELLTGIPAGIASDAVDDFPKGSVFFEAYKRLKLYHEALLKED